MKSRKASILALALGAAMFLASPVHAADKLAPLSFLVGSWHSAGVDGSTSFERAVGEKVIVRRAWVTYPAANGKPASKHEDLMVIYPLGDHLRADYFDSEGYVVPYEVKVTGKGNAVFVSDAMAGAPRARVTYKLGRDGALATNIEFAPVGKPEAFAPYTSWSATKK